MVPGKLLKYKQTAVAVFTYVSKAIMLTVLFLFSFSREIATKVLGAKLLQGYVLKQEQCDKCGMPQMEYEGQLDCVVCPVLTEKAKKNKAKASKPKQEEVKRERPEAFEEKAYIKSITKPEEDVIAPPRTIADFMARQEEKAKVEAQYQATEARRRQEERLLLEETRRLADLEEEYTVGSIKTTDYMQRDLLLNMHRERLAGMAKLDEDILKLEQVRLLEEMDSRRMDEIKRAEEEATMIKNLEEAAAQKQKEADEALERAKAALEFVANTRKELITKTIEKAEADVVAETEALMKQEREDYKEPLILPTASEIASEQWETLRAEARTVMTRRTMAGWTIIAEFCHGEECEHTPLIMKKGIKECVVCGGCGDGTDGAYALSCKSADSEDADEEDTMAESFKHGHSVAASALTNPELQNLQTGFETKRDLASVEIGKKMALGWTLLDSTCPTCVMPLMMDTEGNSNVCVVCDAAANDATSADVPGVISTTNNDPPVGDAEEDNEEVTISVPKGFDFSNTNEVMKLMTSLGKTGEEKKEPEIIDLSVRGDDPENDRETSLSPEAIAIMFMASAMGTETKLLGARMDMDEISDLVEIYVSTHFSDSVSSQKKKLVADAVWKRLQTSIAGGSSTRSRGSAHHGMPPKPESRTTTPKSTAKSTTPKTNDAFVFEGLNQIGASEDEADKSVGHGSSNSFSSASMSLDNILNKIENCKATLMDDDISVEQQVAAAELIEKLSKAALAVKNLEDMEV